MSKGGSESLGVSDRTLGVSISGESYTIPAPKGYLDFNVNLSFIGPTGPGGTVGVIIGPRGDWHFYAGGGIVSTGIAATISPNVLTTGWNLGFQGGFYSVGQVGYSFNKGGSLFFEIGSGSPGVSATGFYIWD